MRFRYVLAMAMLLAVASNFCYAQQAKPTAPGNVKGILRDTVHKYVLKTATVSIYRAKDSTLLNYQLSNNYGEFNIKNLPVGVPLKLEVSHVGYGTLEQGFTIPSSNTHDFGTLILKVRDITLKEVVVKVPPISMNGDTLEINPAAFKLDSNAVIEDVLRRTPGVTLWGDGAITVNGRPVKNVFVDGKPFFGNDPKIALQNLAKDAIQKVQVYKEENKQNPIDSNLVMNVKLKANKKFGMFGKIGAGVGTDSRYEADGNINFYTSKMQLGIVGATNNTNKFTGDATTLLANSTFKGVGANVSYQPDFSMPGLSKPTAGGVVFKYAFKDNPDYSNRSNLSVDYLVENKDIKNNSLQESVTTVANADQIYGSSINKNVSNTVNHNFNANYEYGDNDNSLSLSQQLISNNSRSNDETSQSSFDNQRTKVSENTTRDSGTGRSTSFNLGAQYNRSKSDFRPRGFKLFNMLNAEYSLNINDEANQTSNLSDFVSFVDPSTNQKIERRYQTANTMVEQTLNLELPKMQSIFKPTAFFENLDIVLKNELKLSNQKQASNVQDLDMLAGAYQANNYLSNNLRTNQLEEEPELWIQRHFYKSLSNRYYKSLNLSVGAGQRFILQDNQSAKSFQDIRRTYSQFLPKASISYSNNQYGEFNENININYQKRIAVPNIDQLAPLTDSIDAYQLRRANPNLREVHTHNLGISFSHSDQKNKNTFNFTVHVNGEIRNNGFADSILVDAQNRRTIYAVNVNGGRALNGFLSLNKAYKLKLGEIQLKLAANFNIARTPGYTNAVLNFSNTLRSNNRLSVFYTINDLVAVEASTNYNPSRSRQLAFNTEYRGVNYMNSLSASYNITKKLTLSSNINFNKTTSNNTASVNFTIWNANATYRFLKGNNAEFKLAALDLLHQNTDVINFARANGLTTGTQTVLQQYFMTTLSYYPRMFGKGEKKK